MLYFTTNSFPSVNVNKRTLSLPQDRQRGARWDYLSQGGHASFFTLIPVFITVPESLVINDFYAKIGT